VEEYRDGQGRFGGEVNRRRERSISRVVVHYLTLSYHQHISITAHRALHSLRGMGASSVML
jgi:hypothetical protein